MSVRKTPAVVCEGLRRPIDRLNRARQPINPPAKLPERINHVGGIEGRADARNPPQ